MAAHRVASAAFLTMELSFFSVIAVDFGASDGLDGEEAVVAFWALAPFKDDCLSSLTSDPGDTGGAAFFEVSVANPRRQEIKLRISMVEECTVADGSTNVEIASASNGELQLFNGGKALL